MRRTQSKRPPTLERVYETEVLFGAATPECCDPYGDFPLGSGSLEAAARRLAKRGLVVARGGTASLTKFGRAAVAFRVDRGIWD